MTSMSPKVPNVLRGQNKAEWGHIQWTNEGWQTLLGKACSCTETAGNTAGSLSAGGVTVTVRTVGRTVISTSGAGEMARDMVAGHRLEQVEKLTQEDLRMGGIMVMVHTDGRTVKGILGL